MKGPGAYIWMTSWLFFKMKAFVDNAEAGDQS